MVYRSNFSTDAVNHFLFIFRIVLFAGTFILLTTWSCKAEAVTHFELTPELKAQYHFTLSLDWDKVDSLAQISQKKDSTNGLIYLFKNYQVITRLLIDDRKVSFNRDKHLKNKWLKLIKKGDKQSPYQRYVRAEILLQWSILNYKYGNRIEAMTDVWSAYDLLEDNIKLFPDFISSYRSFGLLRAFLGTLPISDGMKWLLERTSGMSGSISEGMADISRVLDYYDENPDYLFGEECRALFAYLTLHLKNKPSEGWRIIQHMRITPYESPMVAFAMANLALKTGRLNHAIEVINQVPEKKQATLPFNYFLKAKCEMYLQLPESRETFAKFLSSHSGETYRYATYQKLAWTYLIEHDELSYRRWMDQCLPEIELRIGEDKDAHLEALKLIPPNPVLLKARLLFDSHQYETALGLLNYHPDLGFKKATQLEYHYRIGRIYQGLYYFDRAVQSLAQAYDLGKETDEVYSCNAALQLGLIYEMNKKLDIAEKWFENCLALKPSAYKKSLHHKAKSGIKRLKG